MQQTFDTVERIRKLRAQIKASIARVDRGPLAEALNALDKKAAAIGGEGRGDGGSPGLPGGTIDMREPNLTRLNGGFSSLIEHLQSADLAPTQPMVTAATRVAEDSDEVDGRLGAVEDKRRGCDQRTIASGESARAESVMTVQIQSFFTTAFADSAIAWSSFY